MTEVTEQIESPLQLCRCSLDASRCCRGARNCSALSPELFATDAARERLCVHGAQVYQAKCRSQIQQARRANAQTPEREGQSLPT